ncbi:MAG: AMP-binding protein, partial [Hyphomicrobiaceae bacterium]
MEPRLHDPKFERAAREEIERYQTTRVSALVAETWRRNAFYRDHWTAMGAQARDIRTLADFASSVPIVRKADFVADQAGAPPYGKRLAAVTAGAEPFLVFNTSGTSGQGVELHAATYAERRRAFSVSAYFYRWAGLVPGDRVFLCYPVSMLGGGRIEIYGLEDYGLTVFPVATYDVGRKLELMEKFKPHAIMATTSYIGHMAAVGLERGSLQAVKALMGGGEGAGYSWFEQQERLWQAPFFNHYGATQTRVDHMYPCEHGIGTRERPGLMHNIEPGFLIEVIDPATGRHVGDGEHGEIVVTSLIHDTFPLIRYAMGDAGIYHDARYCPCGRPFA